MVGADAMNTPPAHALARRGIVQNVRGYMLYGDYRQPNPPSAIIDAVEDGDVDVAVVWGPTGRLLRRTGFYTVDYRAGPALAHKLSAI